MYFGTGVFIKDRTNIVIVDNGICREPSVEQLFQNKSELLCGYRPWLLDESDTIARENSLYR